MDTDTRKWRIISDYLGNDNALYTTKQLFDYASECNAENANDPDWKPFDLFDAGDQIWDRSHQRGDDGFIAAELANEYSGKSLHEIDSLIHGALNNGAMEYYAGNAKQDRMDLASEVEQGIITLDQAVKTVTEWFNESKVEVSPDA